MLSLLYIYDFMERINFYVIRMLFILYKRLNKILIIIIKIKYDGNYYMCLLFHEYLIINMFE